MVVFTQSDMYVPVLIMVDYPWVSVSGFGAHIKATRKHLIVQKKNNTEQYPLEDISHLLVVGGHTIHSAAINHLAKNGVYITFFEPDGTPVGTIQPFSVGDDEDISEQQRLLPRQRYAIRIARASIKSRLFSIEQIQESRKSSLFYEGELDLLHKSLGELEYLIKLDEIRRLYKLSSDMYYEILSRSLLPELGFRRRTLRPQADPVNAMLSFGYALLFGNCSVAVIGARLNPDLGLLHEGRGGLIYDLIEPLKAGTVDPIVLQIAGESLTDSDFERTDDRCMLSDTLISAMMKSFYTTHISDRVNEQVYSFSQAVKTGADFKILY
ncbi:CRISPR-associated endonuclease Cas1 [Methanoregula sp.]|uniref:CRISPR-associated endonuclease Cas1 n=1 Tax=Methanoregula sp. TaxID=2052170 RepID=UPI0026393760|nr:CRISPR-associated endonuclease Cas1 [Methanoregula sp.]MDD5143560.1 CRISPR-associated endonuclease Cas1 [Methanoregula sp.]